MNYNETLDYLFSSLPNYQQVGADAYKPGLERIAEFCRQMENPQRDYFTIHVAGTNGKGSVSHILASVLREAGYRVGLFTSPHLKDFRERIRVDGEMMPKRKVVSFVDKNRAVMESLGLSFFEMTAAMAFDYFAQSDVEVAVIETGLGGRLDATNLITPILSIVTNIGLEHTALLGDTLPKIAAEKAGIIKRYIPLVVGESQPETDCVFEQRAAELMSRVIYAQRVAHCSAHWVEEGKQHIAIERLRDGRIFDFEMDLLGDYQYKNLTTAFAALDYLHEYTPLTISRRAIKNGVAKVADSTSLLGRWQVMGESPFVVCDAGHNAHSLRLICQELERLSEEYERQICVLGFANDKDLEAILPLLPAKAHYIFTAASISRAMPAEELLARAQSVGLTGEVVEGVAEALSYAREIATPRDMIYVGGSCFVVAEVV